MCGGWEEGGRGGGGSKYRRVTYSVIGLDVLSTALGRLGTKAESDEVQTHSTDSCLRDL